MPLISLPFLDVLGSISTIPFLSTVEPLGLVNSFKVLIKLAFFSFHVAWDLSLERHWKTLKSIF